MDVRQFSRLTAAYLAATVANNQQIVAAVSGLRIRIFGWIIENRGAGVSTLTFKSNSGGTVITSVTVPATSTTFLPVLSDEGYAIETSTGQGLFVDVATTAANITMIYRTYAP